MTSLRQELLEERTSLRFLKKNSKKRQKSAHLRHSRDVEEYLDEALDAATIKTMSDAVRRMIKQFEDLERPFLEPGEQGIHQAANRRSRGRGDSSSPYYTHEAYRNPSYEKRARSTNEDGDDEKFWPQRVRYCDLSLMGRLRWLTRKSKAQRLFGDLSRMQTRRTARQVGGIALMMNDLSGTLSRLDDSVVSIEERLHRVVGVRRVD